MWLLVGVGVGVGVWRGEGVVHSRNQKQNGVCVADLREGEGVEIGRGLEGGVVSGLVCVEMGGLVE